jgi:hypothetical protein
VKATDSGLEPERLLDLSGVWASARLERRLRNGRDPTRQPASGEDRAYKAGRLKSSGAGREFEGSVVPVKVARSHWREGALL